MGASATILCVDDEPSILFSTNAILARAGYEVLTAADADTGIELLKSRRIDLVLLDSLPGRDNLIVEARRASQAVKLLLCTGDPSKVDFPNVDAVVCKPIAPPDLLRLIAETLGSQNGVSRS
jgi:DNA-binding response OmpR family regulator